MVEMMKNIKKYLKLYYEKCDESFKKWGYYYPPRNWEEFEKWNQDTFEKYLQDSSDEISKTKAYISLLNNTKEFGFYQAFSNQNFELLNNVLYQTTRREILLSSITASGTDHCNVFFDALSAFACNDFEVIENLFPKELPYSKGQFYTENAINLLKTIYFKEEHLKEIALQRAEKFMQKKVTAWEKFVVLYFVSLVEKDAQNASDCLQQLCVAYQKLGYPREKIDKCFAQEIHGLYRLVRELDANLFDKIKMPTHDCFFQEFEIWQRENQFPKGKLFYIYPPKLDYMNRIFNAKIPKVELFEKVYSENRKYIFKNVDKFAEDLTANIKENL